MADLGGERVPTEACPAVASPRGGAGTHNLETDEQCTWPKAWHPGAVKPEGYAYWKLCIEGFPKE